MSSESWTGSTDSRHFFLLSGELPSLGSGELRSLVRTYRPGAGITELDRRLLVAGGSTEPDLQKITERAAFTKLAGRVLQVSEDGRIGNFELDGIARGCDTFACGLVNLAGKHLSNEILAELGSHVKRKAPWLRVSLEDPDLTFLVIATETASMVGVPRYRSERRRDRSKTRERAYFHPVALRPKLCRAMINLAMVREGSTIIDPFCGTASILLEGLSMGMRAIGCDISERMCRGALTNLAAREECLVTRADACRLPFRMDGADAIVTDLPYGRGASTQKRDAGELLREFLGSISEMKGGRCCVMCRKGDERRFPGVVETYDVYEHRSLTRKLMVLCN